MSRRKLIGLIMASPSSEYQQHVLEGICHQCGKYGYDVAVFTCIVQSCHPLEDDLRGEQNIFELINFDRLDGIIVCALSLSENNITVMFDSVIAKLKEQCRKPIVILDTDVEGFASVNTDDRMPFSKITTHLLDVHKCRKIYFLTGFKGNKVSDERAGGYADELERHGIPASEGRIFYGDFWYAGGESLADRIISGELERPDAVICANDLMAIGLANKLIKCGIRVPEDVIVTGYDGTAEAAINTPSISSYIPDISLTVSKAVNYLRSIIEPDEEIYPAECTEANGMRICSSCGCPENIRYVKKRLNDSLFSQTFFYSNSEYASNMDIGRILDSYMFEELTSASDVDSFLHRLLSSLYLVRPYNEFFLCLNEQWLNTDVKIEKGYSKLMRLTAYCDYDDGERSEVNGENASEGEFEVNTMLPTLDEEREKASVFYFVPVHFGAESLGYVALRCDIDEKRKIGLVFKNWMRNLNSAIEVIRVRRSLLAFSQRDAMTGLYNRRGMEEKLKTMMKNAGPRDSLAVFVIDMDGLKYINDNFGHSEGDYGINAVASAARRICRNNEICVRAGGDEFYIMGVGDYSVTDCIVRVQQFSLAIEDANKTSNKPYAISASIGYCCELISSSMSVEDTVSLADSRMYANKQARKKSRAN
ncbi:MAG: diguanylate cyclase domain-containing protein [Huintestinicola sp.]